MRSGGRGARCCTTRVPGGRVRGCLQCYSNYSWGIRGQLEGTRWAAPQAVAVAAEKVARGLPGRAGGRCPAAGEGGRGLEGGRARARQALGGREERGRGGGRARAHLSWTAARAELRLTRALPAEEGEGRAGRRGRDAEGRRRRRLGWLARLSLVLPPAGKSGSHPASPAHSQPPWLSLLLLPLRDPLAAAAAADGKSWQPDVGA